MRKWENYVFCGEFFNRMKSKNCKYQLFLVQLIIKNLTSNDIKPTQSLYPDSNHSKQPWKLDNVQIQMSDYYL